MVPFGRLVMRNFVDEKELDRIALEELLRPRRNKRQPPSTEILSGVNVSAEEGEKNSVSINMRPLCVRPDVAAKLMGIGKTKIYELLKDGEFDTLKIGAATLVTVESLDSFIAKRVKRGAC